MKKDITQAIYFPGQLSRPSKNKYQYWYWRNSRAPRE